MDFGRPRTPPRKRDALREVLTGCSDESPGRTPTFGGDPGLPVINARRTELTSSSASRRRSDGKPARPRSAVARPSASMPHISSPASRGRGRARSPSTATARASREAPSGRRASRRRTDRVTASGARRSRTPARARRRRGPRHEMCAPGEADCPPRRSSNSARAGRSHAGGPAGRPRRRGRPRRAGLSCRQCRAGRVRRRQGRIRHRLTPAPGTRHHRDTTRPTSDAQIARNTRASSGVSQSPSGSRPSIPVLPIRTAPRRR
jgi:hypothetical protein